MKEPFVFYRALDPQKGSWDGYGFLPQGISDFFAYVADAPSGASIETPELIRAFWNTFLREHPLSADPALGRVETADGVNRMQDTLRKRSRTDAALYQSTFSLVRKSGSRLFYASIGDSLIFLLRNGALYRLDAAETWNGALVTRAGEDQKDRQKTGTISFAGVDGAFLDASSVGILELQTGDRIVLGSDGIADVLSPPQLLKLLSGNTDLLRKELDKLPAQDDMTFLVLDPDVEPVRDVVTELQQDLEDLKKENSNLKRELSRVSSLTARVELLEKQKIEKPREQARRSPTVASITPSRTRNLFPMWIGIAFAIGLLMGLTLFLWSSSRPQPSSRKQAATTTVAPERQSVSPPEIIPERMLLIVHMQCRVATH